MSILGLAVSKGNFLKHIPTKIRPTNPAISPENKELFEISEGLKAELKSAEARITTLRKKIDGWMEQLRSDRDELKYELKLVKSRLTRAQRKTEKFQIDFIINPGVEAVRPRVRYILQTTIDYFNDKNPHKNKLFINDITAMRRTRYPSMVRHVAMYLAKTMTQHSFPAVGRMIGDRDHTTVVNACRKIDELRRFDPALDADIKAIIGIIEGVGTPNAVLAKPVESA